MTIYPDVVAGSAGVDLIITPLRIENRNQDPAIGATLRITIPPQFVFNSSNFNVSAFILGFPKLTKSCGYFPKTSPLISADLKSTCIYIRIEIVIIFFMLSLINHFSLWNLILHHHDIMLNLTVFFCTRFLALVLEVSSTIVPCPRSLEKWR